MKRQLKTLLLMGFLLTTGAGGLQTAYAQPTTDPCDTANPDEPCPLDGGLTLLLAAGACYGIKKYRSRKSEPSATTGGDAATD